MLDFEALGGAATAGLVAGAIEKPTGEAGQHHKECADCGTETVGRFCHNCGNPSHVHRTLLHLGEELLHGVMHFDSRTWRTLPLLVFRPGRLTRDWCLGKRTRYVSPLAIFLFTVFVMFMALSYLGHGAGEATTKTLDQARAEAVADVQREAAQLARAEAELAAAPTEDRADALGDLKEAQEELKEAREEQAVLDKLAASGVSGADWRGALREKDNGNFKSGNAALDVKIKKALKNPEYALYKLQQSFYKFSFLLVPLSIPFVALLFLWKRGFTLYDHGVFVLYSLTFMSLLLMVVATMARIGGFSEDLAFAVTSFIVPAHMFFQLKGAYSLRTFSALWRTFMLLIFCNVALVLFAAAVIALTFA